MRLEFIPVWMEVNAMGQANVFALSASCAVGRGETREHALERLHVDMDGTSKWLANHGLRVSRIPELPFRVVQTLETECRPLLGESRAFFDWDAQLLCNEEIDQAEMVLHCSRADLLSVVTPASKEILDIRLAPNALTIREILRHVAAQELWFGTCLHDEPYAAPMIQEFGNDLIQRMKNVRLHFQDQFLNAARCARSAQRMRQQHVDRELWTMRKVLRSAVHHEIYHLKQVYRMLTRIRRLPEDVRRAAVA